MKSIKFAMLSHIITRDKIILTLKNTKGKNKTIHVGAHEKDINVQKLAWVLDKGLILGPYQFNLKVLNKNSVRFIQSAKGEYIFDILPDEKLKCTESVTNNDLYVRSNVCCEYKQPIGLEMYIKFTRA